MSSILELAQDSGLIFTGTVVERGRSTVPLQASSPDLMVVRVDRGLRADPRLGDITGTLVTVVPSTPEGLSVGAQAVFFTNSLIHGQGIVAREVTHLDSSEEAASAEAIAALPEEHLRERLADAAVVVEAEVTAVTQLEPSRLSRNAAEWATADLNISKVLKGETRTTATVCFPTSNHPLWAQAPRFKARQRGIFILREPDPEQNWLLADVPEGSFIAPDPADFQPVRQLRLVESLLGGGK